MIDRTPPHDDEAERAAIACCLHAGRVPDGLEDVRPGDLYQPVHETVWAVIRSLTGAGQPCDATAVHARLMETGQTRALTVLPELVSGVWAGSPESLAGIILDRAGRRHIIDATTRTMQAAYESDADYESLLQRAEAELARVPSRDSGNVDSLVTLSEFLGQDAPEPEWVVDGLLARGERVIITGVEGGGKALALDTPLPTPDGWTTMAAVRVGDQVLGADGRPTAVVAATPVMHGRPCYRVEFSDGSCIVADAEHLWRTEVLRFPAVLTTRKIRKVLHAFERVVITRGATLWYVTDVVPVPSVPVRCIQVAAPDRLYLAGESMIPTHNSTLCRQLALCAAAGIQPFTGSRIPPRSVLMIDAENPKYIMQRRYSELRRAIHAHGGTIPETGFWLDRRPEGLNLAEAADRRWLQRRVRVVNPDLLVIGPAYKLHDAGNDDKDETIARTVTSVLDELRGDAALVLEHHAGNEQAGSIRPVRPYGSSLWRRWPEFGYGIRPAKVPAHVTQEEAEARRLVDLVAWRGARDERGWPRQMESGGEGLPWVETVVEYRRSA